MSIAACLRIVSYVASAGRENRPAAGFEPSERVAKLRDRVRTFMRKHVYPAEPKLEVLTPFLLFILCCIQDTLMFVDPA